VRACRRRSARKRAGRTLNVATALMSSMIRRVAHQAAHWLSRVSLLPPPRTAAILPASGASKQKDWSRSRVELVSRQPLILVVHDLLCQAECRSIIEAAQRFGRPMMAGDVCPRDQKYDLSTWPLEDADPRNEAAPLLESLYDRIDAMCGIGRQPGEVPPKVVFSAPNEHRSAEVPPPRRMPLGLHVDTNAIGTYVTALLYLSTVPEPGDGATVFPCAGTGSATDVGDSFKAGSALLKEQALHTGEPRLLNLIVQHCCSNVDALFSDAAQAHTGARQHVSHLLSAAERGEGVSIFPVRNGQIESAAACILSLLAQRVHFAILVLRHVY
jgi:hypothetical protein